jgi:hypothetical protein
MPMVTLKNIFQTGIVGGGVQLGPLGTVATNRPVVPAPGDYDNGEIGGMIGRGNRSTRRKPAPSAALSTTNPACCPDANPGCSSGMVTLKQDLYVCREFQLSQRDGI